MPRPSRNSQDTWSCDDLMALFPSPSDLPPDSLGSDAVVSTAPSSTLPSNLSSPALLTATSVSSTPFRFPSQLVPPSSFSFTAPALLPRCGVVVDGLSAASDRRRRCHRRCRLLRPFSLPTRSCSGLLRTRGSRRRSLPQVRTMCFLRGHIRFPNPNRRG